MLARKTAQRRTSWARPFGIGALQKEFVLAALASGKPCVLDADALTNFAQTPDALFFKLNTHSVLTPHEGEFARLFGARVDPTLGKIARTREAAKIAGCIVLLKVPIPLSPILTGA